MKLNNLLLIGAAFPILLLFAFNSSKETSSWSPPPQNFQQNPPIPVQFWIQKLKQPLRTGENIAFRVRFESDDVLPSTITLYNSSSAILALKDDGVFPDIQQGDLIYSAYKKENLTNLAADIAQLTSELQSQGGGVNHFIGHTGQRIPANQIPLPNSQAFSQGQEVEISRLLLDIEDCMDEIKPENSLFITDTTVVENSARTYNVFSGTGAPYGEWTFGTLMYNINNGQHPDGLRGFMRDFVKSWINAPARDYALDLLIAPWLKKARNDLTLNVTASNWESLWNTTPENDLRINAPFKLTAIVNRLDLRGNFAYSTTISDAGETRFIFTLIDPFDDEIIPMNPDQTASFQLSGGFIDWQGMNIIFEYGNTQTSKCSLKSFAEQWAGLSQLTLGNSTYLTALQSLTNFVTSANSTPSKINGSAINRIRTNEKLFAPTVGSDSHESWELADWEFRQFELNASTHELDMVPLTNNPSHMSNYAPGIEEDYSSSGFPVTNEQIIDWIYSGNRVKVRNGNFNMDQNLLTTIGLIRREETQFFGLKPNYIATKYPVTPSAAQIAEADMIRHQLSLNTCIGCHAGETKTKFVQINSMPYGTFAKYWSNPPSGMTGVQDEALYPNGGSDPLQLGGFNDGMTTGIANSVNDYNFHVDSEIKNQTFFQNLSAMLTGVRLRKYTDASQNYLDDNPIDDGISEAGEKLFDGLFYVADPSNGYSFSGTTETFRGFNDLYKRRQHLCILIHSDCNLSGAGSVLKLMQNINFVPLPMGAH